MAQGDIALDDMALNSDHPQGATPLDPDDLAGLKFAHVTHIANTPATFHLVSFTLKPSLPHLSKRVTHVNSSQLSKKLGL